MFKFAAQYRACQKIVKLVYHSVQAIQRGNLRPVADFMQQDMDNNFFGRCSYKIAKNLEILRRIPLLHGECFDQFL